MIRSRINYWSCSKLADIIRGTNKIQSGTSEEWHNWETNSQKKHPLRYWIAEEGLDKVQNILYFPADVAYSAKCWFKNRFITESHALVSTSLKRGQWHDMDNRMVHCLFEELVNFVEVEKAWMEIAWGDEEAKKKYPRKWYQLNWRSPEAGLAHLNWEMSLKMDEDYYVEKTHPDYGKPTDQAKAAKEIYELYNWWKNVRPNRVDPHDASGWSEYCDQRRKENGDGFHAMFKDEKTDEERAQVKTMLDKVTEIEEAQYNEDTEMLTRLVKIRRSLWT